MASELTTRTTTGSTVYSIIHFEATVWNNTSHSFETWNDSHYSQYKVSLTEEGSSGFFVGDFPSQITSAGKYTIEFFSGTGLETDSFVAGGEFGWDGSSEQFPVVGANLASLAYVKDVNGITISTDDTYLSNRIVDATDVIQTYCDRVFPINNYSEYYDGNDSTTLQLKQTPIQSIASITIGVNDPIPLVITDGIIFNSKTGLVSIGSSASPFNWSFFPSDWSNWQQNILVEYSAGYPVIPASVQMAVAKIVFKQYKSRGQNLSITSATTLRDSFTRKADAGRLLDDEIKALLFPYKQLTGI